MGRRSDARPPGAIATQLPGRNRSSLSRRCRRCWSARPCSACGMPGRLRRPDEIPPGEPRAGRPVPLGDRVPPGVHERDDPPLTGPRPIATIAASAPLAQLDRASDFESAGRLFESGGARKFPEEIDDRSSVRGVMAAVVWLSADTPLIDHRTPQQRRPPRVSETAGRAKPTRDGKPRGRRGAQAAPA